MILSDETLAQIASDANVDSAQFIRFVRVFGLSIVTAVEACRVMARSEREMKARREAQSAKVRPVKGKAKVRQRREEAAARYATEAWRYDVR
jgi:hypothetical protein